MSGPPVAPGRVDETAEMSESPSAPTRHILLGGLVAVAIASVVYSQFNIWARLGRDSAIYVYGGQQVTHGVPPYASIMDPKGPVSGILCGFGVALARLFNRNDLLMTRVEFAGISILGVLAVYLLVVELWHSVVAGVVAAAVFTACKMFAYDALSGPDGHTPGIVFFTFTMWLTVRRQWFLAGLAAALAMFSWQPLFPYAVVVVICAVAWSAGQRLRAVSRTVAGGVTAFLALVLYYAAEGYTHNLFEGLLIFPLRGEYRPPVTLHNRIRWIFRDIPRSFGPSAILIVVGLILVVLLAVYVVASAGRQWRSGLTSPVVLLVLLTLLINVAYMLYDYIGWTHALPLLPYAAAGFGGATALLLDKVGGSVAERVVQITAVLAVTALTIACVVGYYQPTDATMLRYQQASSCAIQRSLVPGTTVWSIDNPSPLVLLHRTNPDNYAYVGGGLAEWRIAHTDGGFRAWTAQIARESSIVAFQFWRDNKIAKPRLKKWFLAHGYHAGYIGQWSVYVTPAALARMHRYKIRLTLHEQKWPLKVGGGTYQVTNCAKAAG